MTERVLAPMLSWQEFLDTARAPESIPDGDGRHGTAEWAGATWEEALRLAVDGWHLPLQEQRITVGALRERAGLGAPVMSLEPVWDVTGSEVDIGAYLAGEPECMVDSVPRRVSRRGKVVTFLIPAAYSHETPHGSVRNRGLALVALCAALIEAGHGVEIWSGFTARAGEDEVHSGVARVITPGEPLDVGRLIFAVAHPAMLRRLWLAVWDGQDAATAAAFKAASYGRPPYTCRPGDLPGEVRDPYVFPYLDPGELQWGDLDTALSWCRAMFAELGLIRGRGPR